MVLLLVAQVVQEAQEILVLKEIRLTVLVDLEDLVVQEDPEILVQADLQELVVQVDLVDSTVQADLVDLVVREELFLDSLWVHNLQGLQPLPR